MTRVIRSLAVLALVAAPLVAQDPVVAARMANVGGDPNPKACDLPTGYYLVGSAATYLQTALKNATNRDRALHDGQRTVLQAITQRGQATNPAAWYYLGRIDLLLGDFAGADTALTKATAMKPDCTAEIDNARYDAWRALVGPGSNFQGAGKADSAMYLYRAANSIYQKKPFAYFQMGEIFKAGGQTDSAIVYLEKAVSVASDTTETTRKLVGNAGFELGALYYTAQKYPDAVRGFQMAVKADPKDKDAVKNLAIAFRAAGMEDSAKALDDRLLKEAQAAGTVTPDQLFDLGVTQFNAQQYAAAAESFEKVLAAQPQRHDALENLANAYFAGNQNDSLIAAAGRLVALEPLNYNALRLLANGYRTAKQQAKTLDAFNRLLGMTTSLESAGFDAGADGATLALTAKGRPATDPAGKTLKPAAIPIVVEFLDATGKVVASQNATAPALQPDSTQTVTVKASGAGIAGWRYRRG